MLPNLILGINLTINNPTFIYFQISIQDFFVYDLSLSSCAIRSLSVSVVEAPILLRATDGALAI